MKRHTLITVITASALTAAHGATTITYEDIDLGTQGYLNNAPYSAAGVTHSNDYNTTYGSWSGFAISNNTNPTPVSYVPPVSYLANQYLAYPGGAAGGSQFALGYVSSPTSTSLSFSHATNLTGMGADFANTTATALDMLNGSGFSKIFGGTTGDDADFLLLTITGFLGGSSTGSTELYLADYRFSDNTQDYIRNTWTNLSFSPLGTVDEIRFTMSSNDNGMFGMNTPAYFAMDNLVVPEPSALSLGALAGLVLLRRRRAVK